MESRVSARSQIEITILSEEENHMRKVLVVAAVLSFGMVLDAADPIVGTWKLNLEKSKLHNPIQSYSLKIDLTPPNTYRCVFDIVNAKGEKRHVEIVRISDGMEHPVEGVNAPVGVTEVTSQDLKHVIRKRNGKLVAEIVGTISADGKVHSVTQTITDASGDHYQELLVFDRQ
jgi:hypothetical protein